MRRYLAFSGKSFYAEGGWNDFRGDADELGAAITLAQKPPQDDWDGYNWWHVVDGTDGKIVAGVSGSYSGVIDDDHLPNSA